MEPVEDTRFLLEVVIFHSSADSLTDFRDEVSDVLHQHFGIKIEAHHHEVATAGQWRRNNVYTIELSYGRPSSYLQKTVKETAAKRGMVKILCQNQLH